MEMDAPWMVIASQKYQFDQHNDWDFSIEAVDLDTIELEAPKEGIIPKY